MSHVVPMDSKQRCAACGGVIHPGLMHTSTRSEVGKFETVFYHDNHCPGCDNRRKASKGKSAR